MKLTNANDVPVYTISGSDTARPLPDWLARKRKRSLNDDFEDRILSLFTGRILPFDENATIAYARIRSTARSTGKAIGVTDAFIAAIAGHHGFTIATRDVAPFKFAGIPVINPWGR